MLAGSPSFGSASSVFAGRWTSSRRVSAGIQMGVAVTTNSTSPALHPVRCSPAASPLMPAAFGGSCGGSPSMSAITGGLTRQAKGPNIDGSHGFGMRSPAK